MSNPKHFLFKVLFFFAKVLWLAPCDTFNTSFSCEFDLKISKDAWCLWDEEACLIQVTPDRGQLTDRSPFQEAPFFPRVPWTSLWFYSSKAENVGYNKGGPLGRPNCGHPYLIPPSASLNDSGCRDILKSFQ